jgi:hypothetical protein
LSITYLNLDSVIFRTDKGKIFRLHQLNLGDIQNFRLMSSKFQVIVLQECHLGEMTQELLQEFVSRIPNEILHKNPSLLLEKERNWIVVTDPGSFISSQATEILDEATMLLGTVLSVKTV